MIRYLYGTCVLLGLLAPATAQPPTRDWPLFGGTPSRNMANLIDKNIPTTWNVAAGAEKNILWKAELGSKTYGGPVVAGGRVFVGTNDPAGDANAKLCKSVVMCFDEKTGKLLWQTKHGAPQNPIFAEVVKMGLLSTPAISGDRLYYVLPECVLICADVKTGKTDWRLDMCRDLKVVPFHCGNCSPLVVGDLVYLVTGNGFDEVLGKVPQPEAPSFIAVSKKTGKLVWKSSLPGKDIIEGSWSNPAYAVIKGKPQVIFPGGDATIYSFEPKTGQLLWKCHCHPRKAKARGKKDAQYIISTPVIHDNKVYVGLGVYAEGGHPLEHVPTYFLCIDATRSGDVSPGVSYDPKAADNKKSAILWAFGGRHNPAPKKGRKAIFGSTMSTCAIHDGLVYIAEAGGYLHCLDAQTGKSQCEAHDFVGLSIWGSPYYVDGKVYLCADDTVFIFKAGKQLAVIGKVEMDEIHTPLHGTPVVANGVLFLATKSKLFAISGK